MPIRLLLLPCCLLASACGDAPQPSNTGAPETPATVTAAPTAAPLNLADLAGEYRVAAIDGEAVDEPFGIALSISLSGLSFDVECGTLGWALDQEDGVLFTNRLPGERRSCDTPIHPRLLQLAAAIDAADRAERTPANGIELSGDGRSVLLFSQ